MSKVNVVLASASPRRRQLLKDAGVSFSVRAPRVDETLAADPATDPAAAAEALAERKAAAVVQELIAAPPECPTMVVGADTMVVCAGEVFGKPRNLDDGKRMLRALSGCGHTVVTGVSVWAVAPAPGGKVTVGKRTFHDSSLVFFRELSDEDIACYLRKGESFDKAGAYAAQGEGAKLIERIDGALDTVIGLPVGRLLQEFPDLK